jgi:MFS family permease
VIQTAESAVKPVLKRLMPFLLLMYVIAFLDRSNVGFAQSQLEIDFGISSAAYAFGAGLFFIGYAVFEVPSNLIMHKVGARWWMARIMVTWGLISGAMMFVNGTAAFYGLRFALGIAEAGFFPGVILYITYWMPKKYANRARGLFYMGLPIANTLGGPLSGALLELDGVWGLTGYQWMFMVEGLLAVVVGFWALWYLTDRPANATWLPQEQREALTQVIASEEMGKSEHGALQALKSGRVWYFALIYFAIQAAVYGLTFFLPKQVSAIVGKSVGFEVGLVTAVPWLTALVAVIIISRYADRTRRYKSLGVILLGASAIGIAGSAATGVPQLALGFLGLAAVGFVSVQPVFWALPSEYLGGTAAAAGIGLINAVGNLGGFLAPNLRAWAESTFHTPRAGLYALAVLPLIGALAFAGTAKLRSAKLEAGVAAVDKPEGVGAPTGAP